MTWDPHPSLVTFSQTVFQFPNVEEACVCARVCVRAACVSACVSVSLCTRVCVCMGVILMGDLLNENERTELKRNWSIVKQTGINNP